MPSGGDLQPKPCPTSTSRHSVDVHAFDQFQDAVSASHLAQVAGRALDLEAASTPYSLSVVIADDATVRELNAAYRGIDEVTDVLSFAFGSEGEYYGEGEPVFRQGDDAGFVTPDWAGSELGEVIVSYPQTVRQAASAGRAPRAELDHLVAHGVLHLLGYDHMNDEEEAEMRAKEVLILGEHPVDE